MQGRCPAGQSRGSDKIMNTLMRTYRVCEVRCPACPDECGVLLAAPRCSKGLACSVLRIGSAEQGRRPPILYPFLCSDGALWGNEGGLTKSRTLSSGGFTGFVRGDALPDDCDVRSAVLLCWDGLECSLLCVGFVERDRCPPIDGSSVV